jgi:tRNA1Val (adenine37-N6)-methyltransferase
MLAQRSEAFTIDAVELDENAYEQAVENFEASDWGDRLYCYHATFQEFATELEEEQETYDLIISNPPFYTDDFKTENESRNNARFEAILPFKELVESVTKILSKEGIFAVVIPYKEEEQFIELTEKNSLFPVRVCHVQGNATSSIKRSLLEFSFQKENLVKEHLIIEIERHKYTEAYSSLTKDFYLKM